MMLSKRVALHTLLLLGGGLLLVGAQADGAPAAARSAKRQAAAAPASPAWVEVKRTKANGSGIRTRYARQTGAPGSVWLEFTGVTAEDAQVQLRAPEGAAATVRGVGAVTTLPLRSGEVTTLIVDVTLSAEGLTYLDVFTTQNGRTTALSVPIGNGAPQLKREGKAEKTQAGESVILLPSQAR